MLWRAGRHEFRFPRPTLVMGVLNVTPDSFSDGGKFASLETALERAGQMLNEGADLVDIGGESTRPGAAMVSVEEEIRRVVPVIQRLVTRTQVPISIDTQKPEVARAALLAGASIVNDIAANRADGAMAQVVAEFRAGYVAMHMQGTPQTMQVAPRYDDVVAEIHGYLRRRRDALVAAGIPLERICLDPGIGFGKTHEHNLALLAAAGRFLDLGVPILVGHSRKGFIGKAIERELGRPATVAERDAGTAIAACRLAAAGLQIVRVHAVGLVRAALALC